MSDLIYQMSNGVGEVSIKREIEEDVAKNAVRLLGASGTIGVLDKAMS